ncbi:MAG: DUF1631 family protein [Burkholderiales bacterium]|nr:DUF1631 family protein [Burkholderiales bacterium]
MLKNQVNSSVVGQAGAVGKPSVVPPLAKLETWQTLVRHTEQLCHPQIDAFSARLSHAMFVKSEEATDAKDANLYFHGAQLLKNSAYTYYYLCTTILEKTLQSELQALSHLHASAKPVVVTNDIAMSLVSYEEMELKLSFSRACRALELAHAEPLAALNMRLASLLGEESLNLSQNPFRPEVFVRAFHAAWVEFNPEKASHSSVLPMLSELIFDLAPIYHSLNELLVIRGVLPDLQETYRKKRQQSRGHSGRFVDGSKNDVARKLEQYFSDGSDDVASGEGHSSGYPSYAAENLGFNPASSELFQYLADIQKNMAIHQLVSGAQNAMRLSQLRQEMPGMLRSGVERNTFDLLSQVFDGVTGDQEIAAPIKELINGLQVPVLKAALMDKNFFFQDEHPARRFIDLLSKYSASFDPAKGEDDPLFQAMQRNVLRVQREFDQQLSLFDEVATDLENFVRKEEAATMEALQAPINRALQKEKFKQASIAANHEVSMRIGTGEVLAFVETFLENRWTKVLTLAYSVKDEKPHALEDALKTMDDLIWSIKPKITLAQRQEMINRLPGILARLNKWLSLIKWEDADRVQFFADLAECHASIVRAPLELSPERQVEIAVEAAQLATERRLEKRAKAEAEEKAKADAAETEKARLIALALEQAKAAESIKATTSASDGLTTTEQAKVSASPAQATAAPSTVDEAALMEAVTEKIESAADLVAALERGEWVEFTKPDHSQQKVRLAWISPMRSLYIFTSSQKEMSFSIPAEELEKNFKEGKARVIVLDKLVDRALVQAMGDKKTKSETAIA